MLRKSEIVTNGVTRRDFRRLADKQSSEIMKNPTLFVVLLWLGMADFAVAQTERYELGQRLKAFENAWEMQTDPASRERALLILPKVSP